MLWTSKICSQHVPCFPPHSSSKVERNDRAKGQLKILTMNLEKHEPKTLPNTTTSLRSLEDHDQLTAVNTPVPELCEDQFPEGGIKAWATVLGAFLIQFCGFGYTSAFGVFQDYYVRSHIRNESPSTISWIGSVNAFLVIAGGLLAGRIYDRGYFYTLHRCGSLLTAFSLFMLSLTQENHFYQVFLCQGVGVGIGVGMLYVPSVAVVSHYFQKRRNFAMTIVASGSSVGAVVHPIMLNNTLDRIGFQKATRANAGLISGMLLISCLLMRTRLPPPQTPKLWPSLKKFSKDKAYICASASLFFFSFGYYFPVFYLQLDAIQHGLSQNFAFYALVILNASSFFGRISSAFFLGRLGVGNLTITATACCSIIIFGTIGLSSVASVVLIAICYGFCSGIYVALNAPFIANLADDMSEIGLRIGIGLTLSGVGGLIGTPIDGALLTSKYIWWKAGLFSGVSLLFPISILRTSP
ncbi:hypothetical protein M422DRAFT_24608 [Sphaerobolus stellatus SS14]|nr:hypothetical protein M422DRAFT_24608 [Sphaerobolus stellatus SS14]